MFFYILYDLVLLDVVLNHTFELFLSLYFGIFLRRPIPNQSLQSRFYKPTALFQAPKRSMYHPQLL